MKQLIIAIVALYCLGANAQQTTTDSTTVEKSVFNVQAGLFGIWINHETRLAGHWALRTELGTELIGATYHDHKTKYALAPVVTLEPRWYYNMEKLSSKGIRTNNNSANYVTASVKYIPFLFTLPDISQHNSGSCQLYFIPKWGLKRTIGTKGFNVEFNAGAGIFYDHHKYYSYVKDRVKGTADIQLRFGYNF